jgi:hypothetical protein
MRLARGPLAAISLGEERSFTVTRGWRAFQVTPCENANCTDSQADSAGSLSTLVLMSGPALDLPVSSPAVEQAVELARRGVITHLTIHGERVAAIVPRISDRGSAGGRGRRGRRGGGRRDGRAWRVGPLGAVKAEFDL